MEASDAAPVMAASAVASTSGACTHDAVFVGDAEQTLVDEAADDPTLEPLELACFTVFRELCDCIVAHFSLADLALIALRLDKAFCAAARARIRVLWPTIWPATQPLLAEPFRIPENDLIRLEKLSLALKMIADAGTQTFAAALRSGALPLLKELTLRCNRIGDVGMHALAAAFGAGALPSLEVLGLPENQIRDDGVSSLADVVRAGALPSLTKLELAWNHVADRGMESLAAALEAGALRGLTFLSLTGNQVGGAGTRALAAALGSGALPRLEKLLLDDVSARSDEHPQLKAACDARSVALA